MISPIQPITILTHVQMVVTRRNRRNAHFSPIMLTLCLMLFSTYYAQNYAGIIGAGLPEISQLLRILIYCLW